MQKISCHNFESIRAKFVLLILGTHNCLRKKIDLEGIEVIFGPILSPCSIN